jgi:hypothetical protein
MPTLIRHPKPDPNRKISQAFLGTTDTELASKLGCDRVLAADWRLAGLSPSYPIAFCVWWGNRTGKMGLYERSCGPPDRIGLVVLREGQYQLVANEADLRELYAPIESEDEALSYAILGTGYDPKYFEEIPPKPRIEYLTEQLEDTHVTKGEDGYTVRLYETEECGCNGDETRAWDVLVTVDGHISRSSRGPVWIGRGPAC